MGRVYTDGACSNNGRVGAVASYACVFPDQLDTSFANLLPSDESQTNQTAELYAIYQAVLKAKELAWSDVTLFTDSMYSKNCLTIWVAKWRRNSWKTSDGKDVIHRTLIRRILEVLADFQSYTVAHVPAHTKGTDQHSKWNDIADKMAVRAIESNKSVAYSDMRMVEEVKESVEHTTSPILPGLPLTFMGAAVSERELISYCLNSMPILLSEDEPIVHHGMIGILKKILLKRGFEIEKQSMNKKPMYRLVRKSRLTVERIDNTQDAGDSV